MVKPSVEAWRLWLGLGLGGLGSLNAVLGLRSIASNLVPAFLRSPCLMALVGLIHYSLWSKTRRSSL